MSEVKKFLPKLQAAFDAIQAHITTSKIGDGPAWVIEFDRLVEEYNAAAEQACTAIWEDTKAINSLSTIRQVYLQKRDCMVTLTPAEMKKFIFTPESA